MGVSGLLQGGGGGAGGKGGCIVGVSIIPRRGVRAGHVIARGVTQQVGSGINAIIFIFCIGVRIWVNYQAVHPPSSTKVWPLR